MSLGWAKKISAARNRSGQAERVPHKPGRKPRVGAEQQKLVITWVASQPDLTLAEIKSKLQAEAGITLGVPRVWRLLRKLNLRLKKSRSTPPNATPKPTKNGARMDNLSSHKVDGVEQRIEKCGAEVLYLPPYSPDLNPIEKAWSKLKTLLRSAKARSKEALDQAITELLPQITPENASAWFKHRIDSLR